MSRQIGKVLAQMNFGDYPVTRHDATIGVIQMESSEPGYVDVLTGWPKCSVSQLE